MSKNAIDTLINWYKAELRKVSLLNAFGSFVLLRLGCCFALFVSTVGMAHELTLNRESARAYFKILNNDKKSFETASDCFASKTLQNARLPLLQALGVEI